MKVIDAANSRHNCSAIIALLCAGLLLIALLGQLVQGLQRYVTEKFRYRITWSIQRSLFAHTLNLPLGYHIEHEHGYLMSRLNEDPYHLQSIMADSLLSILEDAVTLFVGLGLLVYIHWKLALIAASSLPVLVVLFVRCRVGLKESFANQQEKSALVSRFLADALTNMIAIKSFGLEKRAERDYIRSLSELTRQHFLIWRKKLTYNYLVGVMSVIIPTIILWYGSNEILRGHLTLGQYVAFNGFLIYLYRPAEGIVVALLSIQSSISAVERIFELLDTDTEDYRTGDGKTVLHNEVRTRSYGEAVCPAVEFRNVSFHYPGKDELVLRSVSFSIPKGGIVAVVGRSGAGKTTLANLIPRFVDPVSGAILINGIDHHNLSLRSLRRLVTVVPSEIRLFSSSIRENIQCGDPNAAYEFILDSAQKASAHEFIMKLPSRYDTRVGESGLMLSAGQRQRIILARAFLRNPKILILDEAMAFLDKDTRTELLASLVQFAIGRTLMIISHNHSLVEIASKVLVLEEGKLTDLSRKEFLLARSSLREEPADTRLYRGLPQQT